MRAKTNNLIYAALGIGFSCPQPNALKRLAATSCTIASTSMIKSR
jgi:hypothetical protein